SSRDAGIPDGNQRPDNQGPACNLFHAWPFFRGLERQAFHQQGAGKEARHVFQSHGRPFHLTRPRSQGNWSAVISRRPAFGVVAFITALCTARGLLRMGWTASPATEPLWPDRRVESRGRRQTAFRRRSGRATEARPSPAATRRFGAWLTGAEPPVSTSESGVSR